MNKYMGFGGLGDCFIIILKLLEQEKPFVYTHVDKAKGRLELSKKLLDMFGIQHDCKLVDDIQKWWYAHSQDYDKCFNVFAKGYIDIPKRPYHWEPCKDGGYKNPFAKDIDKYETVAVQVNAGNEIRHYSRVPVAETALNNFESDQIIWVGTDTNFKHDVGENCVGKLDFTEALKLISECGYFIGFPSILLYWSLWHKTECFVFTDHQGRNDLRIHEAWKEYITYDK